MNTVNAVSTEKRKNNPDIWSIVLSILGGLGIFIYNDIYTPTTGQQKHLLNKLSTVLWQLKSSFRYSGFISLFIIVLLFFAIRYLLPHIKKENLKYTVALSYLYAVILVISDSYSTNDNWDRVFGSTGTFALSLIRMTGTATIAFFIIDLLFRINLDTDGNNEQKVFSKHFFMLMGIFLLCWLPYALYNIPLAFSPDACDELAQATNHPELCHTRLRIANPETASLWNNHHPVLYTGILWCFVQLGKLLGSYNAAFILYGILQEILMAGVFAFAVRYMCVHGLKKKHATVFVLFFALNPLFPIWCFTVVKDTPFTMVFLI